MNRPPLGVLRFLLCGLLVALSGGTTVAVVDDDDQKVDPEIVGIARSLGYAWEAFEEYYEVASAHGERIGIMHDQLDLESYKSGLTQTIQEMEADVRLFHQNRRWWSTEQNAYHQQLVACIKERGAVDTRLRDLDLAWKRLNEQARMNAEVRHTRPIPMDREGLRLEVERVKEKRYQAYNMARGAIQDLAKESKQSLKEILIKAAPEVRSTTANRDTFKPFVAEFKVFYFTKPLDPFGKPISKSKRKDREVPQRGFQ